MLSEDFDLKITFWKHEKACRLCLLTGLACWVEVGSKFTHQGLLPSLCSYFLWHSSVDTCIYRPNKHTYSKFSVNSAVAFVTNTQFSQAPSPNDCLSFPEASQEKVNNFAIVHCINTQAVRFHVENNLMKEVHMINRKGHDWITVHSHFSVHMHVNQYYM